MSKKMKLEINGLKVQSFVTSLEKEEKKEIHGGVPPTRLFPCTPINPCIEISGAVSCPVNAC